MNFYRHSFEVIFLIISLSFIIMGLYVLVKNKPVILHSRWFLLMFVLMFSPSITGMITSGFSRTTSLLTLVMTVVVLIFLYYTFKGYLVFGVNCDDFQNKFIELLKNKNLEFEQSFSKIIIKEPELEINIALQAWIGTGQIKLSNKNVTAFKGLIKELKEINIKPKLIAPAFYIIIGVLIIIMSLTSFF